MCRSGNVALRRELLQERAGEQGGVGGLHQDDQEEHQPQRRGCCHYGCFKGLKKMNEVFYHHTFVISKHASGGCEGF